MIPTTILVISKTTAAFLIAAVVAALIALIALYDWMKERILGWFAPPENNDRPPTAPSPGRAFLGSLCVCLIPLAMLFLSNRYHHLHPAELGALLFVVATGLFFLFHRLLYR